MSLIGASGANPAQVNSSVRQKKGGYTVRKAELQEFWKHCARPERIVCGDRAYRRYNQAQIDLIKRIKEYQDQGFTLSAAAKKAQDHLAKD